MVHRILNEHNCWCIEKIDSAGLIVDGRDYYRTFYKAARRAQRYILISGWQFDSEVTLLRGDDIREAEEDPRFLEFLNALCEKNHELEIYILAWDFSAIFMMEREWFQDWIFNWTTNERIRFLFDNVHPIGASQHQKFVVIDGYMAFSGGMDICAGRWDDRRHLSDNPDRKDPDGTTYEPYHEMQCYFTGAAVRKIEELFKMRWHSLTGNTLSLTPPAEDPAFGIDSGMPVSADKVALSRTQIPAPGNLKPPHREIKQLYLDAVGAAEHLIYIENQYFSSYAIHKALIKRMSDSMRPKLQIIIVLPQRPRDFKERIAIGPAQARLLLSLKEAASKAGHLLGIYYSTSTPGDGPEKPVYIHSKLILVDDRFLTVGSANLTNRSMGLDAELNISWETVSSSLQSRLVCSIRRIRANLLAEHSGAQEHELLRIKGLVCFLNRLADNPQYRLHHHTPETIANGSEWLPEIPLLDPENTFIEEIEEDVNEEISSDKNSIFAGGITVLKNLLTGGNKDTVNPSA